MNCSLTIRPIIRCGLRSISRSSALPVLLTAATQDKKWPWLWAIPSILMPWTNMFRSVKTDGNQREENSTLTTRQTEPHGRFTISLHLEPKASPVLSWPSVIPSTSQRTTQVQASMGCGPTTRRTSPRGWWKTVRPVFHGAPQGLERISSSVAPCTPALAIAMGIRQVAMQDTTCSPSTTRPIRVVMLHRGRSTEACRAA